MIADLIIIGVQSGCRSFSRAAMPATCGADIDVPSYMLNDRPRLPGGATAATIAWPGAITSGFRRSPPPARSGPREENDAIVGAGTSKTSAACAIDAVGFAPPA